MTELAYKLPRTAEEIGIVCVQRDNENGDGLYEIYVNRARVLAALKWLIKNNILYQGIQIDEVNLQKLPEDGHLTSLIVKEKE